LDHRTVNPAEYETKYRLRESGTECDFYTFFLEEISKETDESQDLAGIVIYGLNKKVDKAIDGLKFHL